MYILVVQFKEDKKPFSVGPFFTVSGAQRAAKRVKQISPGTRTGIDGLGSPLHLQWTILSSIIVGMWEVFILRKPYEQPER